LTIVVVSNELSTDKWLSGLRLHQLDLPRELEEKQPFRRVTELYLNETLLRPEQVNDSSMVQITRLLRFQFLDPNSTPLPLFRSTAIPRIETALGQPELPLSSPESLTL
jgi:hypothetical protein